MATIHVHILIHIPSGYQRNYKRALRHWLPFEWTKTSANVKRIDYPPYGLNKLNCLYGRLRYICKGIAPKTPVRSIEPKFQGEIYGQRWGISKVLR